MKKLVQFALLLMLTTPAWASTWYISTTGSDSNPGTSSGAAWATFAHAWTGMAGGDTLIVGCGTYTQQISPPSTTLNGSSGAYTTIQAATDWCVTIDESSGLGAFGSALHLGGASYFTVRGIKFKTNPNYTGGQTPVAVEASDHIKLIKTAGYDAPCATFNIPGSWNQVVYSLGPSNSYILVEDSYAWGCGRYKFLAYQSDHVIFRHLVARHDFAGGGDGVSVEEQCGLFVMYDSYEVLMQNNIGLDSGDATSSTGNLYGGIWSENNDVVSGHGTSGQDISGSYEGNIFINLNGAWGTPAIQDPKLVGVRVLTNNSFVTTAGGYMAGREGTATVTVQHLTAYNIFGTNSNNGLQGAGVAVVELDDSGVTAAMTDSVAQKINSFAVGSYATSDYNLFYQNTANYGGVGYDPPVPSAGAHDVTANPLLLYPTRVEAGTPGKGTASDGGDRGATILYRIGTPGTMWGDTGYDTLTSTPLWPWNDEAVIKTDMASFSMTNPVYGGTISGARGFAASGTGLYGGPITLTSYVWEALGNACPSGICAGGSTVNSMISGNVIMSGKTQ